MVVIAYVRHGKRDTTNFNDGSKGTIECFLTADGIVQAIAAGVELGRIKGIDRIVASPLPRTVQTARILQEEYLKAAGKSLAISTDNLLIERQVGKLNNRSVPNWVEFRNEQARTGYPLVENFDEIKGRVSKFVEKLMLLGKDKMVIAVSHQDTIDAAIANALKTDELDPIFIPGVKEASITIISYRMREKGDGYNSNIVTLAALTLSEEDIETLEVERA